MMLRSFPERPEDKRKRRRRQRQKLFRRLFKFPQWLKPEAGLLASSTVKAEQDEMPTKKFR